MSEITPRVNSQLLSLYRGRTVRLVGQVVQSQSGKATVLASDKGQVNIHLVSSNEFPVGLYLEIIGRVEDDLTLLESSYTHFGDSMDLDQYNRLVMIQQALPEVFG